MRIATVAVLALLSAAPAAAQDGKGGPSDAPASVVVENRLSTAVVVWVNGEKMPGTIAPGEQDRFDGVPSGRVDVQAGMPGGGPLASEQRGLAPGETFTWTLHPLPVLGEEKGTGTIVLANQLDVAVEVYLGEAAAGSLAPGATRAYARVVAGEVTATAKDDSGKVVAERELAIEPGQLLRWEIGAPAEEAPTRASRPGTPSPDGS